MNCQLLLSYLILSYLSYLISVVSNRHVYHRMTFNNISTNVTLPEKKNIFDSYCSLRQLFPVVYRLIHYLDFNTFVQILSDYMLWIMKILILQFYKTANSCLKRWECMCVWGCVKRRIPAVFSDIPDPQRIPFFHAVVFFPPSQDNTDSISQNGTCLQLRGRNVLLLNQWPIQFHAPHWHLTNKARKVNGIPYVRTHCCYSVWLYHTAT